MLAYPEEIVCGVDGCVTERWDSYELTEADWDMIVPMQGHLVMATSVSPDLLVETVARRSEVTGTIIFSGVLFDTLAINFSSPAEAMKWHERKAARVLDRIDLMESHEVPAVMDGAL